MMFAVIAPELARANFDLDRCSEAVRTALKQSAADLNLATELGKANGMDSHEIAVSLAAGGAEGKDIREKMDAAVQEIYLDHDSSTLPPPPPGSHPNLPPQFQATPTLPPDTDPHPPEHYVGNRGSGLPVLPPNLQTRPGPGDIHPPGYHTGGPGPYMPPQFRVRGR
jgi:hypothetical protein